MRPLTVLATAAALLLTGHAQAQRVVTYTQSQSGADFVALGYPVPQPVASLTPVDGFRDYPSLHARLQSLAAAHDDISAHPVGQTIAGRDIWAYVVSAPGDSDVEGRAKPAFFIQATTHAREWASPEVATGLVERMADGHDDGGLVRYLLDNSRLVIIPVQNVDGFQQTQRFPTQVVVGSDPTAPSTWPRDGRMRRKNMRGADETLTTFADHLAGIDLNRNHPPFWATSLNGSSNNPSNLIHHGTGPHTEPESQAMLQAAALGPVSRMRLGVDLHTFSKVFFSSNTGRTRLNAVQTQLLSVLADHHAAQPVAGRAVHDVRYTDVRDPANRGIGAAAEYFAYQWLVPAWTQELEPSNSSREYGGLGYHHDGFILPDSEIARVRQAWAESFLVGFYYMAGAPHLARVRIFDAGGGALLRERRWQWDPAQQRRVLVEAGSATIAPGQALRVELGFSKPMRHRVNGQIATLPGVGAALLPGIALVSGGERQLLSVADGQWIESVGLRYRDDSFTFEMTAPAAPGEFSLEVTATDMTGVPLDSRPATAVDWSGGEWAGLENSQGVEGDIGGTDSGTAAFESDTAPSVAITLVRAPAVVGEGDRFRLQFQLDEPMQQTIELVFGSPAEIAARPTIGTPPPPSPASSWQPGETGVREIAGQLGDDLLADGDGSTTISVSRRIGSDVALIADVSLQVLDNDRADRKVRRATLGALGELIANVAAHASAVDLVLDGDGAYFTDASTTVSTPVSTSVTLFGNAAEVSVAQASPAISISADGELRIDHLRLHGSGDGDDAAPASRLFSNDGELLLQRSELEQLGVSEAQSLFGGNGLLRVQRSRLSGSSGINSPLVHESMQTVVESSSVFDNERWRLLDGTDGSALRWNSVVNNRVAIGVFGHTSGATVAMQGNLIQRTTGSALLSPPVPTCGSGVVSEGGNLYDAADCPFNAADDRLDTSIDLPQPLPPSTLHPLPSGAAIDAADGCPAVDARGAPRPQTLVPDAQARCDIGAVELGINPYRGLWIPDRPGHGIDMQTSGNLLTLLWYTYTDDGQPTAYQAVGPLTGPRWRATLQRVDRDPVTLAISETDIGTIGLDFSSNREARLSWRFDARGVEGSEGLRAYLFADGEPRVETTGSWFPPAEPGNGMSIVRRGEVTGALLYYYDAAGTLRWMLGTGDAADVVDIEMLSFTGFCPDCDAAAMPSVPTPAGNLRVHFLTPRRARVDSDVTYPGAAGGQWQRSNADFVPINDPVDNRHTLP